MAPKMASHRSSSDVMRSFWVKPGVTDTLAGSSGKDMTKKQEFLDKWSSWMNEFLDQVLFLFT